MEAAHSDAATAAVTGDSRLVIGISGYRDARCVLGGTPETTERQDEELKVRLRVHTRHGSV